MATEAQVLVYIGSYAPSGKEGIFLYRLDPDSGALSFLSAVDGGPNPGFLALHPTRPWLYAINEMGEYEGKPGGSVAAFSLDPETAAPVFLNRRSSMGRGPCHVSVDPSGRCALVANYSEGSVAALPIQADGSLGEATDHVRHHGSGSDPGRQEGPHAHSIQTDPSGRFAYAPDLGTDRVMIYRLDAEHGKLIPNEQPWAQVRAGAGPRHFTFHPKGPHAYVINELDNTVTAFAFDSSEGTLREIQTISTLPDDFTGRSYCADIHIEPTGRFLYGSNRGHDSIALFEIEGSSGTLRFLGTEPTRGKNPRNFGIDPSGQFLLAANQDTDNLNVFRIDPRTGLLSFTGHSVELRKPVCVKFRIVAP